MRSEDKDHICLITQTFKFRDIPGEELDYRRGKQYEIIPVRMHTFNNTFSYLNTSIDGVTSYWDNAREETLILRPREE